MRVLRNMEPAQMGHLSPIVMLRNARKLASGWHVAGSSLCAVPTRLMSRKTKTCRCRVCAPYKSRLEGVREDAACPPDSSILQPIFPVWQESYTRCFSCPGTGNEGLSFRYRVHSPCSPLIFLVWCTLGCRRTLLCAVCLPRLTTHSLRNPNPARGASACSLLVCVNRNGVHRGQVAVACTAYSCPVRAGWLYSHLRPACTPHGERRSTKVIVGLPLLGGETCT
ncbi:hypothetical protein V8C37DRAFT_387654 [Trichoderma ceciliae]